MRISELPFVFLSYDEPWADDFFERLRKIVPGTLRVHGVEGLDACHKAAARAAASRWFVTVDADTEVNPSFLSVELPKDLLNDRCRLDWVSRNAVNGLAYGNGGLKVWPSRVVEDLRSHEAAPPGVTSVDHDHSLTGSRQIRMPGCHSVVWPAETAFHAFRSGFREGARLGSVNKAFLKSSDFLTASGSWRSRHLRVLCTIGTHAPNGAWLIYGARLGLWMVNASDWDIRKINNYAWFGALWDDMITPRFSPGGALCRTSRFTWDQDRLATEITALGERLFRLLGLELPDLSPDVSRRMVDQITPQRSPAHLDTLGYMFLKGQGVARDISRAQDLFETGLLANLSGAINNLARMHEQGQGIPVDPDRAVGLYEYAVSLGNRHAPYHLAQFLKARNDGGDVLSARVRSLERPCRRARLCSAGHGGKMTVLGQLPCLWIAADPLPPTALNRMNRHLRDYFRVAPGDGEAMERFLQRESATHVLIVTADVVPGSSLPLYEPDPLLLASGHCFRLLSRNSVTRGFDNRHGPLICTRDSLLSQHAIPKPVAVVPVALCDWHCNETAESAFMAAFDTVPALPSREANFAATVGADVPHGLSWLLGALSALGGAGDRSASWSRESGVAEDPGAAWRRVTAIARGLRLNHGLDVQPLDAAQSRLAKAISGDLPPARLFHDIAAFYENLGAVGKITAARYRSIAE